MYAQNTVTFPVDMFVLRDYSDRNGTEGYYCYYHRQHYNKFSYVICNAKYSTTTNDDGDEVGSHFCPEFEECASQEAGFMYKIPNRQYIIFEPYDNESTYIALFPYGTVCVVNKPNAKITENKCARKSSEEIGFVIKGSKKNITLPTQ